MRVAGGEGIKGLGREGVEQRVDRIRVSRLQPGVSLKAKPCYILLVDVVIDPPGLNLLAIVARMRDALAIGATISVGRRTSCADVPSLLNGQPKTDSGVPVVLRYKPNIFS